MKKLTDKEQSWDTEFLVNDDDTWGWDGYHLEDVLGFARMYRRWWQEAQAALTELCESGNVVGGCK